MNWMGLQFRNVASTVYEVLPSSTQVVQATQTLTSALLSIISFGKTYSNASSSETSPIKAKVISSAGGTEKATCLGDFAPSGVRASLKEADSLEGLATPVDCLNDDELRRQMQAFDLRVIYTGERAVAVDDLTDEQLLAELRALDGACLEEKEKLPSGKVLSEDEILAQLEADLGEVSDFISTGDADLDRAMADARQIEAAITSFRIGPQISDEELLRDLNLLGGLEGSSR